MNWGQLISDYRLGGKIVIEHFTENAYKTSQFEKDHKRIISSASFRRLQDKTQVFPLDESDFVRTRLTHSFETAAIAKTLGVMALSDLKNREDWNSDNEDAIESIPDILMCAGLLHDIGNPPFGHFGEEIIKIWFQKNLKEYFIENSNAEKPITKILKSEHILDLQNFDGNAQALRILTKLHSQDNEYGMNLTAAILNTLIKYPCSSMEIKKQTISRIRKWDISMPKKLYLMPSQAKRALEKLGIRLLIFWKRLTTLLIKRQI